MEVFMRKVIVAEFMSLDGVMEDHPSWTFRFGSEEQERFKSAGKLEKAYEDLERTAWTNRGTPIRRTAGRSPSRTKLVRPKGCLSEAYDTGSKTT
jgi:hypothetical protein